MSGIHGDTVRLENSDNFSYNTVSGSFDLRIKGKEGRYSVNGVDLGNIITVYGVLLNKVELPHGREVDSFCDDLMDISLDSLDFLGLRAKMAVADSWDF